LIRALIVSRNKREKLACEEPIYWLAGKMRISVTSEIYMERAAYGNSLNKKKKIKEKNYERNQIRGLDSTVSFDSPRKGRMPSRTFGKKSQAVK
jgi:hypothetical protein